eukprot:TRINITY_DN2960_c0_g1_i3.p1 TRINITY_DN2960_c0_g1~~TRINITY_DN2960_c0_g1_i3.p1  ORF type:complete len:1024 (+),score=326.20 TRINITY_DN2960_c0_g1_i3:288-3359(+)
METGNGGYEGTGDCDEFEDEESPPPYIHKSDKRAQNTGIYTADLSKLSEAEILDLQERVRRNTVIYEEEQSVNWSRHFDRSLVNIPSLERTSGEEPGSPTTKSKATRQTIKELINSKRDWNEEFQKIIEQKSVSIEEAFQKAESMKKLNQEFCNVAKKLGKVIISELFSLRRTIPPVTRSVGGIAGGDKYIAGGIFFKVARDITSMGNTTRSSLYGGDHFAQKSASHELKAVMALSDCLVSGLHFPMMAIVDFLGYRLLCSTILPIKGHSTLQYGSADAGKTVHFDNRAFNDKVRVACELLNLKGHRIGNKEKSVVFYGPVDIEGHEGTDKRFYLLDLQRLFPPATPTTAKSFLYRLLRPEFVLKYQRPLSSDAFSKFGTLDEDEHNGEVERATRHLVEDHIPKFAKNLQEEELFDSKTLTNKLHNAGINVRYIGKLRHHVTKLAWKRRLLEEMVLRVAKNILREKMRLVRKSEKLSYRQTVVDFFNVVFGDPTKEESVNFWRTDAIAEIQTSFMGCLAPEEKNLLELMGGLSNEFFVKMMAVTAIRFTKKERQFPYVFTMEELKKIRVKVKSTHIAPFLEGLAFVRKAEACMSTSKADAANLLARGIEQYAVALKRKPNDYLSMYNLASALRMQWELEKDNYKHLEAAIKYLREVIAINEKFYRAYTTLGCIYHLMTENMNRTDEKQKALQHAIEMYEKALLIRPEYHKAYFYHGKALAGLAELANNKSQQREFYAKAISQYKKGLDIQADPFFQMCLDSLICTAYEQLESDPSDRSQQHQQLRRICDILGLGDVDINELRSASSGIFKSKKAIESLRSHFRVIRGTLASKSMANLRDSQILDISTVKDMVSLPEDENKDRWIAKNTRSVFDMIKSSFDLVADVCTGKSCPEMCAGPHKYLWEDGKRYVNPVSLPACEYIRLLKEWTAGTLNDRSIFPTMGPFPPDFMPTVKKLWKRLVRVYFHIYYHHWDKIKANQNEIHINNNFKHFYYFALEFDLISPADLEPASILLHHLRTDSRGEL